MRLKFPFFLVLVFSLITAQVESQNFKPFTQLYSLKTEYFDIIYSEQSRQTAYELASFADDSYRRVGEFLGTQPTGRFPVTITSHTDQFNGYMNPFPYPHILLFDTSMDIEWTSFRNSLESLFVHELTHLISLSSRSPFFDFLYGIFGGWVFPVGLSTPLFMVEGVTVSFESLDGFGRANDPLVKENLRQALRDGRFLSPFQVSGVFDLPPLGRSYYEYGGLFSAYIQEKYGMEKYGRLWRELGSSLPLSFDFSKSGFYTLFSNVYGLSFDTAWADFAASLMLSNLEDNRQGRIASYPSGSTGAEKDAALISALSVGGDSVFVLDSLKKEVLAFTGLGLDLDLGSSSAGAFKVAARVDYSAYDLDASSDGKRLLVSSYRYEGALATAVVTEFDAERSKKTGRSWAHLYKGRYFRDGLVGIESNLHTNNLVYRPLSGKTEVLLEGSSTILFSSPSPLDERYLAFIVAIEGVRKLGLFDYDTKKTYLFQTGLADDAERWKYLRSLRASGRELYATYVHDDRFYKLVTIKLAPVGLGTVRAQPVLEAIFSERDFSGGVFAPVALKGQVYYRAAFSTWDALMRYPEPSESLSGTRAELHLIEWKNPSTQGAIAGSPRADEKPYNALSYFKPLDFWLPFPLLRTSAEDFSLDGGGVLSYLSDPTDTNMALLIAGWDAEYLMVFADLQWTSLSLGFPLQLRLLDGIEFSSSSAGNQAYRASRFSATSSWSRGLGGENLFLSLSSLAEAAFFAFDVNGDEGKGAYSWAKTSGLYSAGLSVSLSTFEKYPWRLFGRGLSLNLTPRFVIGEGELHIEGLFRAAFEFPLRASFYASWDEAGMELDGSTVRFGAASFSDVAMFEYSGDQGRIGSWMAGGELEAKLISIETQTNLSHLYINRLFTTLAWKALVFEGSADSLERNGMNTLQSLVFKTGAVLSAIPAAMLPLRLSPYAWVAVKLSALDDAAADDYLFGLSVSIEW